MNTNNTRTRSPAWRVSEDENGKTVFHPKMFGVDQLRESLLSFTLSLVKPLFSLINVLV